jgi:membrane protease YdiL (CAAX protease family)
MKTNSSPIERFALPLFLILTLVISLAIPLLLPLDAQVVPLLMVAVPAVLAVLLTALTGGRKGIRELFKRLFLWLVGLKWYAIALGLAFGVRLTVSLLAVALGWIPSIELNAWSLPQYIIIGVFIVFGAVTEELGWRGYVLPKLLTNYPALYSALFIGVIWGVIHLGLILPGQMNADSHWLPTILYIVGLSVMLTWLYVQTRGSLVIPILFHAGQSYLIFLNGGITSTQQLVLLTVTSIALAFLIVLLYGVNMQRSAVTQARVSNAQ